MLSIGYGCVGLVILFPVSPKVLVVIYDSKMYKLNGSDRYIVSNNEDEVVAINNLQYVSADEILLGNECDFPKTDNELNKARSISRDGESITRLGSEDNPLWVMGIILVIYLLLM